MRPVSRVTSPSHAVCRPQRETGFATHVTVASTLQTCIPRLPDNDSASTAICKPCQNKTGIFGNKYVLRGLGFVGQLPVTILVRQSVSLPRILRNSSLHISHCSLYMEPNISEFFYFCSEGLFGTSSSWIHSQEGRETWDGSRKTSRLYGCYTIPGT
jgi:hypothetical protein